MDIMNAVVVHQRLLEDDMNNFINIPNSQKHPVELKIGSGGKNGVTFLTEFNHNKYVFKFQDESRAKDKTVYEAIIMKILQKFIARMLPIDKKRQPLLKVDSKGNTFVRFNGNYGIVNGESNNADDYLIVVPTQEMKAKNVVSSYAAKLPLTSKEAMNVANKQDIINENVRHRAPYDTVELMNKLYEFMYNLVLFARQTGFCHGDMHMANVVWDGEDRKFLLIDYGRAFILPQYMDIHDDPDLEEIANKLKEYIDNNSTNNSYRNTRLNVTRAFLGSAHPTRWLNPGKHMSYNKHVRYYEINEYQDDHPMRKEFMMDMDIAGFALSVFEVFYKKDKPYEQSTYKDMLNALKLGEEKPFVEITGSRLVVNWVPSRNMIQGYMNTCLNIVGTERCYRMIMYGLWHLAKCLWYYVPGRTKSVGLTDAEFFPMAYVIDTSICTTLYDNISEVYSNGDDIPIVLSKPYGTNGGMCRRKQGTVAGRKTSVASKDHKTQEREYVKLRATLRDYWVRKDDYTRKKYIVVNKKKIYLSDIRGKYSKV